MTSMKLGKFVKAYTPFVYYQIQQQKFVRLLPEKYHSKTPLTFIMKDRQAGFFSLFFQVLGAVDFCHTRGHDLILDFSNGPYVDKEKGDNWWLYYFETAQFPFKQRHSNETKVSIEEQGDFSNYGRNLPFKIGYELISSLGIRPKEEINSVVSKFVEKNFQNQQIVGIHYRGTDKSIEAPRIPYEFVLNHLKRYNNSQFFVATDEAQFLEHMIKCFGERVLYYDALRSNNKQPIHLGGVESSNYRAGKEALIDCLLLANCNALVRTESNLSLACSFFNPQLKATTLTFP